MALTEGLCVGSEEMDPEAAAAEWTKNSPGKSHDDDQCCRFEDKEGNTQSVPIDQTSDATTPLSQKSTNSTTFQKCNWKKKLCGATSYDIRVAYPSKDYQQQFITPLMERSIAMAVDFWSRAIITRPNLHPKILRITRTLRQECGTMFPENVPTNQTRFQLNFDLMLCIRMEELPKDDSIQVAGAAHSLLHDEEDGLPRIASIVLSSIIATDFNPCDWANVIAHEIGHALGFGISMASKHVLDTSSSTKRRHFCGSKATQEWRRLSGCRKSFPPMDIGGSHWPERDCIGLELMTPKLYRIGFLDEYGRSNERLPTSQLTLAAMEDLGYQVNYDCAQSGKNVLLGQECSCHVEQHDPLLCHPRRKDIYRRRRKRRRFRRKILGAGKKQAKVLGALIKRAFKILKKRHWLKPWWWRRKYRGVKKMWGEVFRIRIVQMDADEFKQYFEHGSNNFGQR